MVCAVVIERGAPLPPGWIAQPDVLVLSQLEGESYSQFARRLRQRLTLYAGRHILKEVRYYAAAKADSPRLHRFRLIALRSVLAPLRRSSELHLMVPSSMQFALFGLVDRLRDVAARTSVNIRFTFLQSTPGLVPA